MDSISLSTLSHLIQEVLSPFEGTTYWVKAEIASLSTRSGHGYFDLVEKGENGLIAAKQRATCWANLYPMMAAYFEQETGQHLQVGMKVLLEVEVSYHTVYGLSLNIHNIDPAYTIGDLARQRQKTILRLQQEGVMDLQKALPLPSLLSRIAVISAEQAAGFGDFEHQLRESGYRISTTLFPAIMQGDRAETSILQALQQIAQHVQEYDSVVIIRGGGATTDLSCFDSYLLSATTAQFPLPILTGIGHTRDISILDMVACLALKTPTAVAAFLIDRYARQDERIRLLRKRLQQTAERQILIRRHRMDLVRQRLELCSPERIYKLGYSLSMVNGKVVQSIHDVKAGQTLTTHLQDGTLTSTLS